MTTARSCTVDAFHRNGRRFPMVAYGSEPWPGEPRSRCHDCGVSPGSWHHPGCDVQRCPACGRQMITCGCRFDEDADGYDDDGDRIENDEIEKDNEVPQLERPGVGAPGRSSEPVIVGAGTGPTAGPVVRLGDLRVIVRAGEIPERDVVVVKGLRCATVLRTVIDLAGALPRGELEALVGAALERGRFSVSEAWERLGQPDMRRHPGAAILRTVLPAP